MAHPVSSVGTIVYFQFSRDKLFLLLLESENYGISGVLGGILRSLFNKETPIIFKKEVYATTSMITSFSYYLCYTNGFDMIFSVGICMSICLIVRFLSVKYKINLPGVTN